MGQPAEHFLPYLDLGEAGLRAWGPPEPELGSVWGVGKGVFLTIEVFG